MLAGGTGTSLARGTAVLLAGVLAAGLLVLAVATQPAEAAFPGASGAIAYTCCDHGNLDVWRMDPDGFGATKLTENTAYDSQPAFSSEGTQIVFNSLRDDGDGSNDWDIYRMNAAGNNERKLTTDTPTPNTVDDVEPFWFANDTKVVFRRNEVNPSNANIWVLSLDENGNPAGEQRLTSDPKSDQMPVVSPNGKLIAFASDRDGDWEIYVMKASAPEGPNNVPRKLTNNTRTNVNDPNQMRDWNPDWSPSGKQLVFESNRDGDDEIFVMNADGTNQRNLTKNTAFIDIDPVFSPDGKKISFERSNPAFYARDIFRMRADGTRQVNLTENFQVEANPAWQPMP
jgi:Tol biopolymer transport system component